ncbi:ABC-2 type transporter family protein [Acanthocheilonema viteae]
MNNKSIKPKYARKIQLDCDLHNNTRQSKHYSSSNLSMFPNEPHSFNYLRYAKADELRKEEKSIPNISIRNLCVTLDKRTFSENYQPEVPCISHFLHDISFTLKGGNTLALLYTKESEMRVLLELMSNTISQKYLISGILKNNGHEISMDKFGDRVAYVNADDTYPWLTVAQTVHLQSLFVASDRDTFKNANTIERVIQALALSPIHNFLCNELTVAERQRLKIAKQILKDTDILLLDNITKGMDLYDMAFVIDYLRDWAIKLNRIVVMAVQPPTIEILIMFHKVLLIASGRVIYFGLSNQMMSYFEEIGYPCPSFKNPCDYYVDLVTHDYLTPESSLESTNRIKRLTEIWKEKAVDDEYKMELMTDELSPKMRQEINEILCFITIQIPLNFEIHNFRRFFEIFLNRPWMYAKEPIYAFLVSLFVGFLFFEIPNDRYAAINARFGFIICILAIFLLPNLFIHIERVFDERSYLLDDIRNRLYDPTFYIIVKIIYDLPMGVMCNTLYTLPAYILSGLPPDGTFYWPSLLLFTVILCAHMILWRYLTWIVAYCCCTRISAIVIIVALLSNAVVLSGFLIHPDNFPAAIKLLYHYNPTKLAGGLLAENEFLRRTAFTTWFFGMLIGNSTDSSNITELLIGCERRQVLAKKINDMSIYTASHCPKIRGSQALYFSGLSSATFASSDEQLREALHVYIIWFLAVFTTLLFVVRCNHKGCGKSKYNLFYS